MIVDESLLEAVAKQKKYTFISTGMSSYKYIDRAVKILEIIIVNSNLCNVFQLTHLM